MKTSLKSFAKIIFTVFLFLPLFARAGTFNYLNPGNVKITTTDSTATYTITSNDSDGMYDAVYLCNSKDHPSPDTDCKKLVELNIKGRGSETHTVTNLNPNTSYYIFYDKISTGSTQYDYDFLFKTDPIKTVTSNGYSVSISQKDTNIYATIKIPSTETRPITLAFENLPGIVTLQEPLPDSVVQNAKTTAGSVYSLDSDSKKLLVGSSYGVYLEVDSAPLYTKLVGPYSFTYANTTIAAAPLTYDHTGSTIVAKGKIDLAKNPDFKQFHITFDWYDQGTLTNPLDDKGPSSAPNIADDGSYTFTIQTNPSTIYFIRQTIVGPNETTFTTTDPVNSSSGIVPTSEQNAQDEKNQKTYRLLAPLPGLSYVYDPDYCAEQTALGIAIPANAICDINQFLNYMMKLLIGLAGVMLVLRIMYEGYRFMTTDAPYLRASAKAGIGQAVLGLALALTAWIILNTINPQLVSNTISLNDVAAGIESFTISGGASFNGQPVKVDFDKEAYPAAVAASTKTGVDTAFILAMFDQESGNGSNSGKCNTSNANMYTEDQTVLQNPIIPTINTAYPNKPQLTMQNINVSCGGSGSNHGGAIGYTQFRPVTWNQYRAEGKGHLNHEPYPWDPTDALMMTAVFLENHGGAGSDSAKQETAACNYFGSCNNDHLINCHGQTTTYGQCVLGKKVSIQQQIDEEKKAGKIK